MIVSLGAEKSYKGSSWSKHGSDQQEGGQAGSKGTNYRALVESRSEESV